MRAGVFSRYLFITITLFPLATAHLAAQQITTQAPPVYAQAYPLAKPVLAPASADSPVIETDSQSYRDGVYTLDGHVVITYGTRRVEADHITYDTNTNDLTSTGHLLILGGENDESIAASHGTFNTATATGTFYDVTGSVGIKAVGANRRAIYTNGDPFLFTGRMVVKTGPRSYDVYSGTVTSCQLPKPDWILSAAHFSITPEKASAHNSTFRLLNVPLLYLPYVTHPLRQSARQFGFVTPTLGQSSTRGFTIGEQIYAPLGRSADITLGADYYSCLKSSGATECGGTGFAQTAAFRYRGPDMDFANLRYFGVIDRRVGLNAQGQPNNQGGEDVVLSARYDLSPHARAVAEIDYLSSYVFRQAFTDNFNQAVTSDITSTAYFVRAARGLEYAALFDRYQGIKLIAQGTNPQQQVRIFHAPTLSLSSVDHRIASTGLQLALNASASGLKRSQANFVSSGIVERFDFHPEAAYPLLFRGLSLVPSVALRETLYTRSRLPPMQGRPVTEVTAGLARSAFEFAFAVRPPVLSRTFAPSPRFARLLGTQLRHTIEPALTYRLTTGVANFNTILRFDSVDVLSNTNEAEYGVTQRLFRRTARRGPCPNAAQAAAETAALADAPGFSSPGPDTLSSEDASPSPAPAAAIATNKVTTSCTTSDEFISWRLTQKYFFDPTFGGAILTARRNLFETTLNLSGIAFLTEPREISPLVSRLRVRTSAHTDIEWDFDLDTGAKKFTSSNVYLDLHQGPAFAALSYARLDAPGRFYTQNPDPTQGTSNPAGITSSVSDFNQLRVLLGFGSPLKPGLSLAANTGLDLKSLYGTTSTVTSTTGLRTTATVYPALLQYAAVQAGYNWNCCGLALEYRKFELGSVRNENSYKFNFTLANIGTAGNLRRAERLF